MGVAGAFPLDGEWSGALRVALLSHLASESAPTGAEHSLSLLAGGLADRGHEVAVAVPGPWALSDRLEDVGVEMATIPVRSCWLVQYAGQPLWRQVVRGLRFGLPDPGSERLRRWLGSFGPEVVHVNCLPHLRGAAAAAAEGVPVIWHIREILPPGARRRWFATRLRRYATRIVAVSEAVAGWLRDEGLGDRVTVVHNGVDPPAMIPEKGEARARFGLPEDGIVVGLFSQLVEHKGGLDFVHAAHKAAERDTRMCFLIAGHGQQKFVDQLRTESDNGPAAGRIHFAPPQDDIWSLLSAVDLVSITTLWPDPLPRVVMEAMAAQRPVVAYSGGGVPEMVVDGETGLLCEPGDVSRLVQGWLRLADDQNLRHRMGEVGRLRAIENFSVHRHVDEMEKVLSSKR